MFSWHSEQQAPACQNNPSQQQHLIYLARAARAVNSNPFSQPVLSCRCSERRGIWVRLPHLLGLPGAQQALNQQFEP